MVGRSLLQLSITHGPRTHRYETFGLKDGVAPLFWLAHLKVSVYARRRSVLVGSLWGASCFFFYHEEIGFIETNPGIPSLLGGSKASKTGSAFVADPPKILV